MHGTPSKMLNKKTNSLPKWLVTSFSEETYLGFFLKHLLQILHCLSEISILFPTLMNNNKFWKLFLFISKVYI